jgi:hypothetical protein
MYVHVLTGNKFEVWFSGTTPQNSRYRMLNCAADDTVLVGIWFSQSWRLDIYIGDTYFEPENAALNGDGEVRVLFVTVMSFCPS